MGRFPFPHDQRLQHLSYPRDASAEDARAAFLRWRAEIVTSDGARITFDNAENPYVAQVKAFAGWVAGEPYDGATGHEGAANIALLDEARSGLLPASRS